MSYPPLSGYGGSYDGNQQQPSAYSSNRSTSNNPYAPVSFPPERQSQYATSAYEWQGQGQQNYGQNPQQYGNVQQEQYDYGRESGYAPSATSSSTRQMTTHSSGTMRNLQGLNNLAYASDLDSRSNGNPPTDMSASVYSRSNESQINRTQSPAQGSTQTRQYSTNPPATNNYNPAPTKPANANTQQVSLAQALAGAVSRKTQQAQAAQGSTSPNLPPPSHRRAPSQTQQTRSSNVSKQRVPATARNESRKSGQASSASQSNTISNLVTSTPESAPTQAVASEAMPTYIDPSQVFNPYHREHERRRKEAAEAEVRKQHEEERQKEEEARKKAEDEAAAKVAASAAEATKTKERQQKNKKNLPKAKKQTGKKAAPEPPAPPPVQDDMAAQMKFMMDKMKEFRQQDPTMFQKLWDDMRKGGSNAVAGSSTTKAPSASPRIPQPSSTALAAGPVNAPDTSVQPAARIARAEASPAPSTTVPADGKRVRREPRRPIDLNPNVPLNGWKVVVEDNEEGLPDLGRFPAERRIRVPYEKQPKQSAQQDPKMPAATGPVPNQSLPAKNASGGVEWPKDKRDTLATAAITALKTDPINASVVVTPEDINSMLDINPNYIDLCDMLEKKGLQFNRGQFARQLLSSVPDLSKAQKQPTPTCAPASTSMAPNMAGPPNQPGQTPIVGSFHPPPLMNGLPMPMQNGQPGPMSMPGPMYKPPYAPAFVVNDKFTNKRPRSSLRGPPPRPEPPPGSKEAMARKRDFSELVDLTQLNDNENYVLSSKHPRLDSPSPEPMDILQQFQSPAGPSTSGGPSASFVPGSYNSAYPPQPPAQAPPPPPQKPRTILARAVNKDEALTKEYYNPKTVARDIMIAAGRHPTERPLNAHMAGLLNVHIELESDLSTFDWDAIDPGGPPAPKVEYVDIPAAPPRYRLGQKVHKQKRERDRQEGEPRLPEQARLDLPAATTSPALLARLDSRNKLHPTNKERPDPRPSRLRESLNITLDESITPSKRKASTPLAELSPKSSRAATPATMDSVPTFPSGKRRGRPPGSKNKNSAVSAMRQAVQMQPRVEIPITTSSPQTYAVYKCRWPRCGDELHNLETLRKHISKKHRPDEEDLKEAKPYKCWWKKCPVRSDDGSFQPSHEHDDAAGLMDHLDNTHLHELAMKLGDGPSTTPADPQAQLASRQRYLSDAQGRTTTPAISLSPELNNDLPTDTWIITSTVPRVETSDGIDTANGVEADANAQAHKSFLKTHRLKGERGAVGLKAQAEETLRAMERRKKDTGVGLDRGGCTLVNEARRATLIMNPGVRRVIDADA